MEQHPSSNNHTVAWFKLAQCVTKGQKERALGIFKLLSHSLNDKAFVHQLEGDIFLAFSDPSAAATSYAQAAKMYQQENRLLEAALIYDHLTVLQPMEQSHRASALTLYNTLGLTPAIEQRIQPVITALIAQQKWQECHELITHTKDNALRTNLNEQAIKALLASPTKNDHLELLHTMVTQIVEALSSVENSPALQKFLTYLQTHAPEIHEQTLRTINNSIQPTK